MTTYTLPNGVTFRELEPGNVLTTFPDGKESPGIASYDQESVARARALGYVGDDRQAVDAMTRDHELLHSLVAYVIDGGFSHALRYPFEGVQEKGRIPMEERLVLTLQRAINDGRAIVADHEDHPA